jgi:hypothetical protein
MADELSDWIYEDPDSVRQPKGRYIISNGNAKTHGIYDKKDGPLWKKAINLTRADMWALAGFGVTNKYDAWTLEELNRLAQSIASHCNRPYSGVTKYGICCSCG